ASSKIGLRLASRRGSGLACGDRRRSEMYAFSLPAEQRFDAKQHVERVLGTTGEGDVTIACWEPGQTSPYHCHPDATEIYFCFEGGGTMRTPTQTIVLEPGSFVVHPRGELHEYINGPQRTLLFRVRYGDEMPGRTKEWPSNPTGSRVPRTSSFSSTTHP